ncbi:hypothetical protein [Kordiimonas sp.]|uniref:hypothetical protein n=1 Tax=Kordiimonas sp. TaxID=1970157 RepID=UPI003A8CD1BB
MRYLAVALGMVALVGCDQAENTSNTQVTSAVAVWQAGKQFTLDGDQLSCAADETPYYWRGDIRFTESNVRERTEAELDANPELEAFYDDPVEGEETRIILGCSSEDFIVKSVTTQPSIGDDGMPRRWTMWKTRETRQQSFDGLPRTLLPAIDQCPAGTEKFAITATSYPIEGTEDSGGIKSAYFWGCRSAGVEIKGAARRP